jgi:hypothetical protein
MVLPPEITVRLRAFGCASAICPVTMARKVASIWYRYQDTDNSAASAHFHARLKALFYRRDLGVETG